AADGHRVRKGLKATLDLPNGTLADGKVSRVGPVARQTAGENGGTSTTIEVEGPVPGRRKTVGAATVHVTFVSARRADVLATPVGAVLAWAEGGHGVQVVEGGTTRYAAVKTGMFAEGQGEIAGLSVGTTVAVPK